MTTTDAVWRAVPSVAERRHMGWRRAEWVVLAILGVAQLSVLVAVLADPGLFDLPTPRGEDLLRLLGAASLYVLSQVARVGRLILLVPRANRKAGRLAAVHFFTVGAAVLLPFKLSEVIRIREVGVVAGSWRTGLLVVWIERALDATVLSVLIAVAIASDSDALALITPLLVVFGAFIVLTLVLFFLVPGNLRGLALHMARHPGGAWKLWVVRTSRSVLTTLQEAPALLRGRIATLLVLSTVVWVLEALVVVVAVPGVSLATGDVATGIVAVLSGISTGTTAIMPESSQQLTDLLADLGSAGDVGLYRLVLIVPALAAGVLAALAYLPGRRPTPQEASSR